MVIAVVDGQGGGIGKTVVENLRARFGGELRILALGTNPLATSLMLKSGANDGASGENAIVFNASRADIIIGSIGIIAANSMLGEMTPLMASAISESTAKKVLIPFSRCNITIAGANGESLPFYVDQAMHIVGELLNDEVH